MRRYKHVSQEYEESNARMEAWRMQIEKLESLPQTVRNISRIAHIKIKMDEHKDAHKEVRDKYFNWLRQSI